MKIGVIGDPHFGSSYHFGHVLDNNLNSRLLDYSNTLKFAIRKAADAGAKIMMITGDLFKTCRPGTVESEAFWSILEWAFHEYGMVFYIAAGNHDMPTYSRKTVQQVATNLNGRSYIIACDTITAINLEEENLSLVLVPFFNKVTEKLETNQDILDKIESEIENLDLREKTVAVWHGLSEGTYLANYTGMEVDALSEPVIPLSLSKRFNVCVFGHVHRFTEISRDSNSLVVNIGSMEVNDFTDTGQSKYMIIVDTDAKGKDIPMDVQYIELPVVKAETIKMEVNGTIELGLKDKIDEKQVKDKIVRLQLVADEDSIATFDDNSIREYMNNLGVYKYMSTTFKTLKEDDGEEDNYGDELDLSTQGNLTMVLIEEFLKDNNLPLIPQTMSYAKDIVNKITGDMQL